MPVQSPSCEALRVLPATGGLAAQPGQSELPAGTADSETRPYTGSMQMDGCIGRRALPF